MAIPFLFLYPHFIDTIIEGEAENSLKPAFRLISGTRDRINDRLKQNIRQSAERSKSDEWKKSSRFHGGGCSGHGCDAHNGGGADKNLIEKKRERNIGGHKCDPVS